jgi:hypothetical protein
MILELVLCHLIWYLVYPVIEIWNCIAKQKETKYLAKMEYSIAGRIDIKVGCQAEVSSPAKGLEDITLGSGVKIYWNLSAYMTWQM